MSKTQFIQLADTIRTNPKAFTPEAIQALADFCYQQNPKDGLLPLIIVIIFAVMIYLSHK